MPTTGAGSVRWRTCASAPRFQCATVRVPLDYDRPQGRQLRLAVTRLPASGDRIGSLFFNPGGPGGPGVASLQQGPEVFPQRLRQRFDLVSWDPRGIGDSTAVQCFANPAAEDRFRAHAPFVPANLAQTRAAERVAAGVARRCLRHNEALLRHMSTADTARDLDVLRAAVGDDRLRYWGISYGTLLGATYANLFPDRVGALTLDANVRPHAWGTAPRQRPLLPTFLRQHSYLGAAATLRAFMRHCTRVGDGVCPFAERTRTATTAKLDALMRQMRRHPGRLRAGMTFSDVQQRAANGLYFLDEWPNLAADLQRAWTDAPGRSRVPTEAVASARAGGDVAPGTAATGAGADAAAIQPVAAGGAPRSRGAAEVAMRPGRVRYAGIGQQLGVVCGESPNPGSPRMARISAGATHRYGALGPFWTWVAGGCAQWLAQAADPYAGPWNTPTAAPILVVNTTHDPATPLSSARVMARSLGDARLLVMRGYGHTALLNPSTCVNRYVTRYFVRGALPPVGTRCSQDAQPFGG